ncbi:MAG: NfeD family protein [Bacteroidota bacterium]
MSHCHRFLTLLLVLFSAVQLSAQKVYVLRLQDEVNASTARFVSRGFEDAAADQAELVILHMNTLGGRVDYADTMRNRILDAPMPTAVFIDRNAASAGALLSIACDSIYMAPAASIGAATVVLGGTGEAAPDKYQSYWRAIMRSTAERTGRDPRIAEKMVDEDLDLPGISPKGQVITFSTREAIENGYCEGEKQSLAEVAQAMGVADPELVQFEGSSIDQVINFLIRPGVSAILILLIFGGIFLEMKTPGMGFAGLVALFGIALFFAPHYIEGLAAGWEIAVFLVGVILIALEIFVIPGFGIAGILGIVCAVGGVAVALLGNDGFSFEYVGTGEVLRSVALVLVMLSTAILLVVLVARYLVRSRAAYPFVDQMTQDREQGYTVVRQEILELIGSRGVSTTDLRPSGYIEIEGRKYDAEAKEGFIAKDRKVVVDGVRSINLIVREA